ncbi:Protein of unknown function [Pyronema omphalodes CBS 100304]|uniref:Uncharacterized protein n=1 Tax=Pyronema omphalodes (strain CBS 100304) TaxID=1076935 RepID=U4LLX2_PYROM|nr:Protein of unknown function [Pyronema omphalodes CBS 100304]
MSTPTLLHPLRPPASSHRSLLEYSCITLRTPLICWAMQPRALHRCVGVLSQHPLEIQHHGNIDIEPLAASNTAVYVRSAGDICHCGFKFRSTTREAHQVTPKCAWSFLNSVSGAVLASPKRGPI